MLAFGALAVPLSQLTFAKNRVAAPAKPQKAESHRVSTLIRLRYAHKPSRVSLRIDGRELLPAPALESSPIEATAEVDVPHEGIEFVLSAEWPGGTRDTAVTLELEPDGLDTRTQTCWSDGNRMTEVVAFQWK